VQLAADLQQSDKVPPSDDTQDMSVRHHRQLIDALAAHQGQRVARRGFWRDVVQRAKRAHSVGHPQFVPVFTCDPLHRVGRDETQYPTTAADREASSGESKQMLVHEPPQRGIGIDSRTLPRHDIGNANAVQCRRKTCR
jgi:hypothetical protein